MSTAHRSMQDFLPPYTHDDATASRRASAQRRHDELQAERRRHLAALSSTSNTPQQRIELWERLHALQLPKEAAHRLVRVIASQTQLSVTDVHNEQARRAASFSIV
jgi:hypothetical protein